MNFRLLSKIIGLLLLFLGLTQAICLGYAYRFDARHDQLDSVEGLSISVGINLGACLLFLWMGRGSGREVLRKEAIAIVGSSWLICALFGSLPYMFSEPKMGFCDAFFESMSGFTTTGASIIDDLGVFPQGILLWRCLTQWLGGMGILVLFVAVLSYLGAGSKALFRHESSAKEGGGLQARIHNVAIRLWQIYLFFSLLLFLGFLAFGMPVFDAVCHTFTTISTGGFSPHNSGLGYYNNTFIEIWAMIFMVIGGVSFMLYAWLLRGRFDRWKKEEETKYFIGLLVLSILLLSFYNASVSGELSLKQSFRYTSFQVVSLMTSSGFVIDDYDQWPPFTILFLVGLMLFGGCAGSTTGGIKVSRWIVFFRTVRRELNESFRPKVIRYVGLNGNNIDEEVQQQTMFFIAISAVLVGICALILSALEPGLDVFTCLSGSIAMLMNIGPALGDLGPTETYASLHPWTKVFLAILMAVGRLEIFAILVLFFPSLWRTY